MATSYSDALTGAEDVEDFHQRLSPPPLDVIRYFKSVGVSVDALVEPELPAFASVDFHDKLPRFGFTDEEGADGAIIFLARDEEGEPCDLVAWSRKRNRLASWNRSAVLLSLESYWASRIETDGLRVFADPLDWLCAGRAGVVIVDHESARWELADDTLIVSDAAFGRLLREALRLPEPKIFVEQTKRAAA